MFLGRDKDGKATSSSTAPCISCGKARGATLQHLVTCPKQWQTHARFDASLSKVGVQPTTDPWQRAWYVFNSGTEHIDARVDYTHELIEALNNNR